MDKFRELAAFVMVADEGAFNRAAQRLASSPPGVTRLINGLEERLGVQLLKRTTRSLALTDAGKRFYADAQRLLADLEEAEASAVGQHFAPCGMLHMTAPILFGQKLLSPVVREFLDVHEAVTARLFFMDRVVNLMDEGLDLALRIGELPPSSLIASKIGSVRHVMIASPDYLAKAARLREPDDLVNHRTILSTGAEALSRWEFGKNGNVQMMRIKPTLSVNTMTAAIDAAVDGWGVTRVLSYQVTDAIRSGDLIEVLPTYRTPGIPVHLVHLEVRHISAKLRAFIDFAVPRLRERLSAVSG